MNTTLKKKLIPLTSSSSYVQQQHTPHNKNNVNNNKVVVDECASSTASIEQQWNELSIKKLQEMFYYDRTIAQHSKLPKKMIEKINEKILRISDSWRNGKNSSSSSSSSCLRNVDDNNGSNLILISPLYNKNPSEKDNDDKCYEDEMKFFTKVVRDRQSKAECEKLEKMKYKVMMEERTRKFDYENRGKKRTPMDIEISHFLRRPIQFIQSKNGRRKRKVSMMKHTICHLGNLCELCNGYYATSIVTHEEIDVKGCGDILKALPIPIIRRIDNGGGGNAINILNPPYREVDEDSDDTTTTSNDDENKSIIISSISSTSSSSFLQKEKTLFEKQQLVKTLAEQQQECSVNFRRLQKKKIHKSSTIREYWKLMGLKHNLQFIQEYNGGLICSYLKHTNNNKYK